MNQKGRFSQWTYPHIEEGISQLREATMETFKGTHS